MSDQEPNYDRTFDLTAKDTTLQVDGKVYGVESPQYQAWFRQTHPNLAPNRSRNKRTLFERVQQCRELAEDWNEAIAKGVYPDDGTEPLMLIGELALQVSELKAQVKIQEEQIKHLTEAVRLAANANGGRQ